MSTTRLLGAVCACAVSLITTTVHATAVSGQGAWESTLQARDLDGNLSTAEAYYDTDLDITWLADANYAATTMTWAAANTWAASLNPYSSGITGWRLPTVSPVDGTTANDANYSSIGTEDRGYNISAPGTLYAGSTASEMAHMYYNTLGNLALCNPTTSTVSSCDNQVGWGTSNTGPFSNIQSVAAAYWSATEFAPDTSSVWFFGFGNGRQDVGSKQIDNTFNYASAWAVQSGDIGVAANVSAVPVPAATWLFGSGLLGLIGVARRKIA